MAIAVVGTLFLSALGVQRGPDATRAEHYDDLGESRTAGAVATFRHRQWTPSLEAAGA